MIELKSMTDEQLDDLINNPRKYLKSLEALESDIKDLCRTHRRVKEEMERMTIQMGDLNMRIYKRVRGLRILIAEQERR